MHIGLIGGIGPAATDLYYRGLVAAVPSGALELTVAHADAPTLVARLMASDEDAQADTFAALTERLAAAGAEAVAVTSIGGHFCIEPFKARSKLPVLDLLTSVSDRLARDQRRVVGVIGTGAAMTSGLYGRLGAVETLAPEGAMLHSVHKAYLDMAFAMTASDDQRRIFHEAGASLVARGAEAVLLGGTDLFLAFDDQGGVDAPGFDVVDCARIHIEDIAAAAVSG
ncbi:MAG: aspartate/glutamate racemase family protein [Pseudomonadota bacterium]